MVEIPHIALVIICCAASFLAGIFIGGGLGYEAAKDEEIERRIKDKIRG